MLYSGRKICRQHADTYFLFFCSSSECGTEKIKRSNHIRSIHLVSYSMSLLSLFFLGILEMIIISSWTKVVSETRVLASGIVTMINIVIWFYVLQTIVENITNWRVMFIYALGCAIGTMLSTAYFRNKDMQSKKETITPPALTSTAVAQAHE